MPRDQVASIELRGGWRRIHKLTKLTDFMMHGGVAYKANGDKPFNVRITLSNTINAMIAIAMYKFLSERSIVIIHFV